MKIANTTKVVADVLIVLLNVVFNALFVTNPLKSVMNINLSTHELYQIQLRYHSTNNQLLLR